MRKSLLVLPVLALLVLVGCGKQTTTVAPVDTTQTGTVSIQTYEGSGFTIEYPNTWTYQENVYGSLVMFFSPQPEGDKFRENIGIVMEALPTDMTVNDYYTSIKNQFLSSIQNYQEISSEDVTINGIAAKKLVYQGTQGAYTLQWMQVFLVKDKKAYLLNYTATVDTFNERLSDSDSIMNSIIIK